MCIKYICFFIQDSIENNPLGDGGERVDFTYSENLDISKLDMYQQNHIQRYLFAENIIQEGEGYMAAFFRQVKIGVLTLTLEKKQ